MVKKYLYRILYLKKLLSGNAFANEFYIFRTVHVMEISYL